MNCLKTKTAKEIVDAHPAYDFDTITLDKGFWEQTPLALVVDNDFLPKVKDFGC